MKISASEQVQRWLVSLPPDSKKRVRAALRGLQEGHADIKALRGPLEGFCRLRVGGLRIIYSHHPGKLMRLEYADTRDAVYETFLAVLRQRKASNPGGRLGR
jgi:mRNA-degrading endonuclease RelE of RelBE toxin-antitoxin system